jgi:hypothetical protein
MYGFLGIAPYPLADARGSESKNNGAPRSNRGARMNRSVRSGMAAGFAIAA